jgi:membrane protein implicated in regulation of membrane protease activity
MTLLDVFLANPVQIIAFAGIVFVAVLIDRDTRKKQHPRARTARLSSSRSSWLSISALGLAAAIIGGEVLFFFLPEGF